MTARSVRNHPSITSPIRTSAFGPVARIVVILSCPSVGRVSAPVMVITGRPSSLPSTSAVTPGRARVNGSGAKAAVPKRARTGSAQRARTRGRVRRVSTHPI